MLTRPDVEGPKLIQTRSRKCNFVLTQSAQIWETRAREISAVYRFSPPQMRWGSLIIAQQLSDAKEADIIKTLGEYVCFLEQCIYFLQVKWMIIITYLLCKVFLHKVILDCNMLGSW